MVWFTLYLYVLGMFIIYFIGTEDGYKFVLSDWVTMFTWFLTPLFLVGIWGYDKYNDWVWNKEHPPNEENDEDPLDTDTPTD